MRSRSTYAAQLRTVRPNRIEAHVMHPYMRRPGTVTAVVVLVWISAIFALLVGAIMVIGALVGASAQGRSSVLAASLVIGVLFLVVGVVTAAVASRLSDGGNGARLLVSVLQVLQIAGGIASLSTTTSASSSGLGNIVVGVVILLLLWNERANDFFHRRTA